MSVFICRSLSTSRFLSLFLFTMMMMVPGMVAIEIYVHKHSSCHSTDFTLLFHFFFLRKKKVEFRIGIFFAISANCLLFALLYIRKRHFTLSIYGVEYILRMFFFFSLILILFECGKMTKSGRKKMLNGRR
jgi:hypothetical protein